MRLIACLVVLSGCGATQLERAKDHRRAALAAQAAGDMLTANAETQATINAARKSRKEGDGADAQTWILQAWGHLALGQIGDAQPALKSALKAHRGGAPDWQQRVLIAAQCAFANENKWWHFAALCHDHLLSRLGESGDGLQAFALEGFGNANARYEISYAQLVTYDDPLFRRAFEAARAHPLNGDLVAILGKRLQALCDDPGFYVQISGWRAFQLDLLRAAKGIDNFTNDARRKTVAADLARAERKPLCGGAKPPVLVEPMGP